ncbi:MAG: hypothetical protein P4L71_09475 [Acetobacteraceae bacterium]|nr:hypothetical protein [Acetobacteraceae bacterium]
MNGPAIGVGTTMLAHCDRIVARRIAKELVLFRQRPHSPEAQERVRGVPGKAEARFFGHFVRILHGT